MLRIRKISNPYLDVNIQAMNKVKSIIREQFPDIREEKIDEVSEQLVNPLKYKYQTFLIVADDTRGNIRGFALLLFMPDLKFCYLDFLAVSPGKTSSGVGGAIYEKLRDEALALRSPGIFFECLPDNPDLCTNKVAIEQNKRRLAFYEQYGARPVINTKYETPVKEGDDCPPYLVFDDLGKNKPVSGKSAQKIIRAILERKYVDYCPESYIKKVVGSVKDDPIQLRPYRYKKMAEKISSGILLSRKKIFLVVNDKHELHHIKEVGYVESPVRITSIMREIENTEMFRHGRISEYPDKYILEVHDKGYVNYFKKVCSEMKPGKSVYPYVFPIRNAAHPPKELSVRAGYYCIDTFTPLNMNAYLAARRGVNCTLTAADAILEGTKAAYVLTRPPGHHAERFVFGGFCYFNNNAVAANYLSRFGKVAILDVDYHHGNGQQQIFYDRSDVLTISIHGHPSFAYPYFSGFREEKGEGAGTGFNINHQLQEILDGTAYRLTLSKALKEIGNFKPDYLVVALGLDTAKGDPTGTWNLSSKDFEENGKMIASLHLPTLVVQEGGYRNRVLGINARAFFRGLYKELFL
jgi:acetoin utilization deacetylase AcuC-like enzyme